MGDVWYDHGRCVVHLCPSDSSNSWVTFLWHHGGALLLLVQASISRETQFNVDGRNGIGPSMR